MRYLLTPRASRQEISMSQSIDRRPAAPSAARSARIRREEWAAYAFLSPWLIGLIAFTAVPILTSIYVSMTDWKLLVSQNWIGLENYRVMLFEDPIFWHSIGVTLKYTVLSMPLYMTLGLALALLLNQKLRAMNLFRTIFYIPAVLSGVAVAILWLQLFNPRFGAINYFLRLLGVDNPPRWFDSPTWAMPALVIVGIWGVGGGAVIYLAGLQNISPHLYEAAEIDGAGAWAKFRHVTLPMLSPTLFFTLITGLIDSFQMFGLAFIAGSSAGGTAGGGPGRSLLFYLVYLYRTGFVQGRMGYASALAWVLVVIAALTIFLVFRLERRFVFYELADERA
jgi:multiple sugar transport system permease protein